MSETVRCDECGTAEVSISQVLEARIVRIEAALVEYQPGVLRSKLHLRGQLSAYRDALVLRQGKQPDADIPPSVKPGVNP